MTIANDCLEGKWFYGLGSKYILTALDSQCYFYQEVVNGKEVSGTLSYDGEWYNGPLSDGNKDVGSIRVRPQNGKVISNFRPQDNHDWGNDIVASAKEDLKVLQPLFHSIKGYTWAEDANTVTMAIALNMHLYNGAAEEITDVKQITFSAKKEALSISVRPNVEEVWSLDLYPLADEICHEKAEVGIYRGDIVLWLPKAVPGKVWGRVIGDVCKSWRDVGRQELEPQIGGVVACARRCRDKQVAVELEQISTLSEHVIGLLHKGALQVGKHAPDLNDFSMFLNVGVSQRQQLLDLAFRDSIGNRAIGAMMGMAIADTMGSPLEFLPVGRSNSYFDPITFSHVGAFNKFRLQAGQWTDDTSMSLCLADSLLACGKYDGSDIRVRFWNWWNRGYNNAFRLDASRNSSVGLGGNIGKSLADIKTAKPPPRFDVHCSEDSGNGSIMRLAPVPIYFHRDIDLAVRVSAESSLTTHPGSFAADACAFLGFLIVRAMTRPHGCERSAASILDECCEAYLRNPAAEQQHTLKKLLVAREPVGSTERCWNWRDPNGPFLAETLASRGRFYNGYPVDSGYFGSYCMDGLAVALHCVYHTTSFMDAIIRCVNFLGDADSVGAICGQIAGAIYGVRAMDERLIAAVEKWDGGEIALRAALLYAAGTKLPCEALAFAEPDTASQKMQTPVSDRSRSRSREPMELS